MERQAIERFSVETNVVSEIFGDRLLFLVHISPSTVGSPYLLRIKNEEYITEYY